MMSHFSLCRQTEWRSIDNIMGVISDNELGVVFFAATVFPFFVFQSSGSAADGSE